MPDQNSDENIFQDQLDNFTDREAIIMLFDEFLRTAHPGHFRLLAVKGNSGTGKSFLISYLSTRVCSHLHWHSGLISFSQSAVPDFRYLISGLEAVLKGCVPHQSLENYRAKRDAYLHNFDQYRLVMNIHQQTESSNHSMQFQVSQQIQINAQLRERELHLRAELRQALIELIEDSEQACCLFIDGYERLAETDIELTSWLGDLLDALARAAPQPFQGMICGWQWPTDFVMSSIQTLELTDFDRAQVQVYLEKQGIIERTAASLTKEQEELITAFCALTQGPPIDLKPCRDLLQ